MHRIFVGLALQLVTQSVAQIGLDHQTLALLELKSG